MAGAAALFFSPSERLRCEYVTVIIRRWYGINGDNDKSNKLKLYKIPISNSPLHVFILKFERLIITTHGWLHSEKMRFSCLVDHWSLLEFPVELYLASL